MKAPTQLLLSWLLLTVTFSNTATACLNEYKPNRAVIVRSKSLRDELTHQEVTEKWRAREARLRKELNQGGDYRVKNDLATTLAHTGKAAEAATLLEQIEAEKPGLYATATNLGTAYELSGNSRKALEWIKKGIERNPESHNGTEWLHVRILEAKLALRDNPKWLESNSVLGSRNTDGEVHISVKDNNQHLVTNEQAKSALKYQLHERLQFAKAPDAIVGSMLLDLGTLISEEPAGIGGAADIYALAQQYLKRSANVDSLKGRVDLLHSLADQAQKSPPPKPWYSFAGELLSFDGADYLTQSASIAVIGFSFLLLVLLAMRFVRQRRKNV